MDEDASDPSGGYEARAIEYMRRRDPVIGAATVRAWAGRLPPGAAVLDLGCGHGVPISQTLFECGLRVHGVDASATLVAAFRERFPQAAAACEDVEHSRFFGRTFEGVVACGLLFLLDERAQMSLIHRVGTVLEPGGSFLFSAPAQACRWIDVLTGRESVSLGRDVYETTLAAAGFVHVSRSHDEGGNHFFAARMDEAGRAGTARR